MVAFPSIFLEKDIQVGMLEESVWYLPSVKELRPFSLEMMRGKDKKFGMCCQSVNPSLQNRGITVSFSLLNVTVLQTNGLECCQYQKAVLKCVNWERTDGCCFVDKAETGSVFV